MLRARGMHGKVFAGGGTATNAPPRRSVNSTMSQMQESIQEVTTFLARSGFTEAPHREFPSDPAWAALRGAGTQLWLDTGDLGEASGLWCREFSNLTTNNTLVNREVQKGQFDDLIRDAGRRLRETADLDEERLIWEVGFIVNCRTALRLVQAFDATVSVELHPAMADDVELSVAYGRRYYAVCPERFIVKVPLTPAGLLVARRLSAEGVPVNFTLGFSTRQNVLAAAFSRPAYVNVFMGRLNSFVADSGLGSGENIGEKTTMATQLALLEGRHTQGWETRLIGASMRSGAQVWALAGLDVFTMPVAAAREFKEQFDAQPRPLDSQVGRDFPVETDEPELLSRLWTLDAGTLQAIQALQGVNPSRWGGKELAEFVRDHGAADLLPDWTPSERAEVRAHGKIPSWERWREALRSGRVGLDALMSLGALESFVKDQTALDDRIRRLLSEG